MRPRATCTGNSNGMQHTSGMPASSGSGNVKFVGHAQPCAWPTTTRGSCARAQSTIGTPVAGLSLADKAEVNRLEAVLRNARRELNRQKDLAKTSSTSRVTLDDATMNLEVAIADLAAARAQLDLTVVTSPIRGQVLDIHTRPGERIGPEGILELGRTDQMYAIAEVYETDIAKIKPGQQAVISLAALDQPLTGTVEDSELRVGRLDVLGTDPVAKTDARVVEVKILLDDGASVARYTDMQVEVEITL